MLHNNVHSRTFFLFSSTIEYIYSTSGEFSVHILRFSVQQKQLSARWLCRHRLSAIPCGVDLNYHRCHRFEIVFDIEINISTVTWHCTIKCNCSFCPWKWMCLIQRKRWVYFGIALSALKSIVKYSLSGFIINWIQLLFTAVFYTAKTNLKWMWLKKKSNSDQRFELINEIKRKKTQVFYFLTLTVD